MAHVNYTFDEIRAKIVARGSKASKIDWLTKEAGFNPSDAESTYRLIMMVTERPERPARALRVPRVIRFTMGVELECTNVNRDRVRELCAERGIATHDDYNHYNHRDSRDSYKLMSDGSLGRSRGDIYPTCEIVTPILHDLNSLKTVCDVINEAGAGVNSSCGLHVHFGAKDFTDAQWRRIVLNYAAIEPVIDTFMAYSRRGNNSTWCGTMRNGYQQVLADPNMTREQLRRVYRCDRYHKVNLEAFDRHQTIEFRQHAGTTNFKKIENWVNFLAGLLTYSIQNESIISANTIDELPFLTAEQKRYFNARAAQLAR